MRDLMPGPNNDEFLQIVKDAINDQIGKTCRKRNSAKNAGNIAEEIAKIGIMVSSMLSVERIGTDVRIVVYNRTRRKYTHEQTLVIYSERYILKKLSFLLLIMQILTDALPVKYERNHRCAVNGCWNRPHLMTMQQLVYETESIGGFIMPDAPAAPAPVVAEPTKPAPVPTGSEGAARAR